MPIVGSIIGFLAILFAPILRTIGVRFSWSWAPLAAEAAIFALLLVYWNVSGLRRQDEPSRRTCSSSR